MKREFLVKEASFLLSTTSVESCPAADLPEFALIGRSNVGKSSLINMLTNRLQLAKTSSTPGKTQTINYFLINQAWYLVDLPGYGWARVSDSERKAWEKMVKQYISRRASLHYVLILIDSRLSPQKLDIDFVKWIASAEIPFAFIFTKADKVKTMALKNNINKFLNCMLEFMPGLPPYFITSSHSKMGRQEILNFLNEAASTRV